MKFKKPVIYALVAAGLLIGAERACYYTDKYIRDKAAESILESYFYGKAPVENLSLDYPK
jgi:hypothetical protein